MNSQTIAFHKALKAEAMKKANEPVTLAAVYLKAAPAYDFTETMEESFGRMDVVFLQHYFAEILKAYKKHSENLHMINGYQLDRILENSYIEAVCIVQRKKFSQVTIF
jgi:hypothetical protein